MSRYVIDKGLLLENIRLVKEKAGTDIIGVVKGNGYGFGIKELSQILFENGITAFAVTEPEDIRDVRSVVGDCDILVMRSTCIEKEAEIIAESKCIATIGSLKAAETMDRVSKALGVKTKCHLKIDTGLGRYGFMPGQVNEAIKCYDFENLDFIGAYTHFSSAFTDAALTKTQLELFKDTINQIRKAGKNVGVIHAANSPALLNVDDVSLDCVRIGSAFTGRVITKSRLKLNRIGSLQADVIEIKTIPAGYSVGYNGHFKAKRETKLAIIPFGHYDGFGIQKEKETADFHSVLSQLKKFLNQKRMYVKINGRLYSVAGEIGLSHTAVDITGSDVKIGDTACVDISPLMVNPRIPRIYK